MRKTSSRFYLYIVAVIFLLMSLSVTSSEKLRGATIALLSPIWETLLSTKEFFKSPSLHSKKAEEELQRLRLENQLLLAEINTLQDISNEALNINYETISLHKIIPARVIFRSPSSWNSSLWINIGEANNTSSLDKVIEKNSPVLFGGSLIGVIDYVGLHQSRVRLITDSGLSPSVRAVRGGEQNKFLANHIDALIRMLGRRNDLHANEKKTLIEQLDNLKKNLNLDATSWYLAKGELHGTSQPLWRTRNNLLQGKGFNYDFNDDKGMARDLRTGKLINEPSSKPIPLLKVSDLLMTTGMDGVFPAGLNVAEITKIYPLKEGDFYYDLEAKPSAGNLDDLSVVFVIPPLGYNPRNGSSR